MALPEIVTFWTGNPFGLIERLCIQSFLDVGHPVTLYSYGPVGNVPEGVTTADANAILPEPGTVTVHARTQSPAPFADRFRYLLLRDRPGVIWADTDAYCVAPFQPRDGYFLGYCDRHSKLVNNGVLALPPDSPALAEMIAYTSNETAILPWLPRKVLDEACRRHRDGDPMHITEFPWGVWGPEGLTYTMRQSGEIDRALPPPALYPILFEDRGRFFRKASLLQEHVTDETMSIHLYGRRVRARLNEKHDGVPPPGTILEALARRHGLMPEAEADAAG